MYSVSLRTVKDRGTGAASLKCSLRHLGNIIRGLLSAGIMKCFICKANCMMTKTSGQAVKIIQRNNESIKSNAREKK